MWSLLPALRRTVVTSVCPSMAAHISGVMSFISKASITALRVIYNIRKVWVDEAYSALRDIVT